MSGTETWSAEEKARFRSDWDAGMSLEALAVKYDRSTGAIKRARRRFQMTSRHCLGETKLLRARLPKDLLDQVEDAAKARSTTVSMIVRSALEKEISPV